MKNTRRNFIRGSIGSVLAGLTGLATWTGTTAAAPSGLEVGGVYRLAPTHSGHALDVKGGSTDSGANVQQWGWDGGDHQRWRLDAVGDGYYRLVNVNSGMALDVEGGSTEDGANVQQWSYWGGRNQQWAVERQRDGSYRLRNAASGKVLDVAGRSTDHGANVHQWTDYGNANQRWNFEQVDGNGAYFDPSDGFAAPSWFGDDVDVYRIRNATRSELEAALHASGPRLVVFETSGTIDLGAERLAVTEDECWIAGQTAPSPGITLVRGEFAIEADDCVVQHVRSRPGDAGQGTGWEPDAITTADGTRNNVFDHVSASWSVDEVASPGYHTTDTTLANCLIAEALRDSTHSKGNHSMGSLVGDGATNVAVLGSVFAHNETRNVRLKADTESVVANNVVYHFDEATNLDDSTVATVEGNAYLRVDEGDAVVEDGSAYLEGNYTAPETQLTSGTDRLDSRPLWPAGLRRLPTDETEAHALAYAGARPADRTHHDRRIVDQVRNWTGGYVDSQDDVGGYPDLPENTRALSVPDTGLREWLEQWALAVEEPHIGPP